MASVGDRWVTWVERNQAIVQKRRTANMPLSRQQRTLRRTTSVLLVISCVLGLFGRPDGGSIGCGPGAKPSRHAVGSSSMTNLELGRSWLLSHACRSR